jgi:hypothetical protein
MTTMNPGIYRSPLLSEEPFLTLEEIYRHGVTVARDTFLDAGALIPSFIAAREDGRYLFYLVIWDSEDQKNHLLARLKAIFRESEIVRFTYFGEAWIVTAPLRQSDGSMNDLSRINPQTDDRRRPCLHIVATDRSGHTRGCAIPIVQGDGPPQLGKVFSYDDDMIGGDFNTMIDRDARRLQ